jgi:hypothetical protein
MEAASSAMVSIKPKEDGRVLQLKKCSMNITTNNFLIIVGTGDGLVYALKSSAW